MSGRHRDGSFLKRPIVDFLRALISLATPTSVLLFSTRLETIHRPKFVPGEQRLVYCG
jgi:hypothetical protein